MRNFSNTILYYSYCTSPADLDVLAMACPESDPVLREILNLLEHAETAVIKIWL